MEIVHISAEAYPMAKAGGLGDVVGALPKYQTKAGHVAKVVMPMYRTKFLYDNQWDVDFKGKAWLGDWQFDFTIIKLTSKDLGYDLFLVDINGLLDRQKVYGYDDDAERFTAFQIAVLQWMVQWQHVPDIIHCHDHHTGLIPFMMKHCYAYRNKLSNVPSVLTIHNAQYQGWMGWDKSKYIPEWDSWRWGDLDWANSINPLASAIKCAWRVTTVSQSYMEELRYNSNGLEALFEYEKGKCSGILNGIDYDVWNPEDDKYLTTQYNLETIQQGKQANKAQLCERFRLDASKPLFVFIGRLVGEKAAEILPDTIATAIHQSAGAGQFLVLGSGDPAVERQLNDLKFDSFVAQHYNCYIGYDEALSHVLYAGADFLLMPSRVEPCGLNQMYALRYGTVPLVRSTGGLQDTVVDMGDWEGFGIRFTHATTSDLLHAIRRALEVYGDKEQMDRMRQYMMQIDHSWESSVNAYLQLYQSLKA